MANITVACKLPNGLVLDLGGKKVVLKGSRDRDAVAGFGLTQVDDGFWSTWATTYKDFPALKRGLIFAHAKESGAAAESKEKQDVKSGLEGLDPEKPGTKLKPENYEGMPKPAE
ncbi:hypothetical protein [Bordetella genomosp. 11]|uniref:Uncharacterized protein n=1 Tax=Bordetella genomosp. 11 TaxID=1416808 RepID=A0A261UFG7_9BORD|nr:hypothetical protein [Bordetella genomosp. 11]OZI59940.1 hypothetical protein CAL28_10665 [Bordetella genomosp. 11]